MLFACLLVVGEVITIEATLDVESVDWGFVVEEAPDADFVSE